MWQTINCWPSLAFLLSREGLPGFKVPILLITSRHGQHCHGLFPDLLSWPEITEIYRSSKSQYSRLLKWIATLCIIENILLLPVPLESFFFFFSVLILTMTWNAEAVLNLQQWNLDSFLERWCWMNFMQQCLWICHVVGVSRRDTTPDVM